jgi:hypothetical protein
MEAIAHQRGRVRRRSEVAIESLKTRALEPNDANVSLFVKKDKTNFDNPNKPNPDPRAIQPRSPRYNVRMLRYSRPIEKFIFKYEKFPRHRKGRVVLKGLNCRQRASLLRNVWESFEDPVFIGLDCKRFDYHVEELILKSVHDLLRLVSADEELEWLIEHQIKVKGYTSTGIKYIVRWLLCSGDVLTSLVGVVGMVVMVLSCMDELKVNIDDFYLLDDGDDAGLVIESREVDRVVKALPSMFLEYGHELKIEQVTQVFENVTMCQMRPILLEEWTMCPDPRKVLNTFFSGHQLPNPWDWPAHLRAVAACYNALVPGCPVLGKLVEKVLDETQGVVANYRFVEGLLHKTSGKINLQPDRSYDRIDYRLALYATWDLPIEEQVRIEGHLERGVTSSRFTDVPLVCTHDGVCLPWPRYEDIRLK